jgi:DNA polymerase I
MVSILDGNHLACRCFFAIDPLTTSNGQQTNLVYGFINTVKMFVSRYGSENHLFITWDAPGKKTRHELYPEYKADRKPFPQEFYDQLDITYEFISALNIPQYKITGIEADDIIGTLTKKSRKKGQKVLIISSDHDFEQLISPHVKVLVPSLAKSKEFLKDYNYVIIEYEDIKPSQLIELYALTGDSSDNIKGLEKVGIKTAIKLLKANGTLENIVRSTNLKILDKNGVLKDAKDDLKKKVNENKDILMLNKKLVTIDCDLDSVEPYFNYRREIDFDKLYKMFEQYEFKKFLKDIDQWKKIFSS